MPRIETVTQERRDSGMPRPNAFEDSHTGQPRAYHFRKPSHESPNLMPVIEQQEGDKNRARRNHDNREEEDRIEKDIGEHGSTALAKLILVPDQICDAQVHDRQE